MGGVQAWGGIEYVSIGDDGLHIRKDGEDMLLPADNVIVCAGQAPNKTLHAALAELGIPSHIIGGADIAAELDAKRAIAQGAELAAAI